MKFSVNQVIEIVDGTPRILSTDIQILSPTEDLYSLARKYLDNTTNLQIVERKQYRGYRAGKRYLVVLMKKREGLTVCHDSALNRKDDSKKISKLFPYLLETEIDTVANLNTFLELLSISNDLRLN